MWDTHHFVFYLHPDYDFQVILEMILIVVFK